MTQVAIVQELEQGGYAKVLIERQSACGHDCSKCHGCNIGEQQKLVVRAKNTVGARRGDQVVLESGTGKIMGAVAAVYVVPLILFFLGYLLGGPLGMSYVQSCILGGVGFGIGIVLAIVVNRIIQKNKALEFSIVSVKKG